MLVNRRNNLRELFQQVQKGFSMLEVLVTILVLSLGLLGMAALVTTGMRSNNVAQFRSIATQQTLDIADRMRANLAGVRAGDYDALATGIPASNDCAAAECTAAQMAAFDHARWNTANSNSLPGGQGTVTGTLVGGFTIALMWTEKEMGAANDPACNGIVPAPPAATRCFLTRFSP
jgi:type IV pilus assembly protein PilV